MKKRVLSVLMALTLVLGLFPALTPHAHGEEHVHEHEAALAEVTLAAEHTCADTDRNHHCDDAGCRKYIACYDENEDAWCDICGACMTTVDEDDDKMCDICGVCVSHTFEEGYWRTEDGVHYPECDRCFYYNYAEGAACADGDGDGLCDACGDCADGEHSYEWDSATRDFYTHRMACKNCGEAFMENHADGEDADAFCDVCGSCMDGQHGSEVWNETDRDDADHRMVCEICGAANGWMNHSDGDDDGRCDVCDTCMNGGHRYDNWGEENRDDATHRLVCSDCGLDSGWEDHTNGGDGDPCLCDVCLKDFQHTYDEGKYHQDQRYHYLLCDVCGDWSADEAEAHGDSDSDCACDVCGYSMHQFDDVKDLGNGTHEGVCTACGKTVAQPHVYDDTKWDETGHWDVCACGAVDADREKAAHVYESNNWYIDRERHYPECDGCGYHQPEGESHDLPEGSEECTICGHTIHNYVWDKETWDHEDHWVVCGVCGDEDWEDHSDGDDDGRCDVCSFNMVCSHPDSSYAYNDGGHWNVCGVCGDTFSSLEPHRFDDEFYHEESDMHYPKCDSCEYYLADEGEPHADGDADGNCDDCGFAFHEHTYEEGHWHSEGGVHYPDCDKCEYYDAAQGADCTDEDGDACCDVCGNCEDGVHVYAWDEETRDDADHLMVCSVCGDEIWEDHSDDHEDGLCDVCGTCMDGPHTYVWKGEDRDPNDHLLACSVCGIKDWVNHTDDKDSNGLCDVCGTCMVHENADYVWDSKTWDNVDHWLACKNCGVGYGWENHADSDDNDKLCDVCGFNMACSHSDTENQYDADGHWTACSDCERIIYSPKPHSFESQNYYKEADKHYPECDGCEYYSADEGVAHADKDADEHCDACDYWIHEHTYENEYFWTENGKHYPMCELCSYYDSESGEACIDKSGDHGCDVCYAYMEWLCDDADDDHICDVCESEIPDLCTDTNNDHVCDADACQRYMRELCAADTGDSWICGTCGKNFCNHYFHHEPTSNGNGTHTGTCDTCGEATEDCYVWSFDYSLDTETTHTALCRCGYRFPAEAHTYDWSARSVTGHRTACKDCYYEKEWEAHTVQNGTCTVCEMQVTAYDDVYVGGVGLKNGQYLSNSGSITTTRPAGGYACYKNGVLELNGYVYEGSGILWKYNSGDGADWAAIYATKELTLALKGENSLKITWPDAAADELNYSDGIAAEQNLTIRGDGSLTIEVEDDGVDADPADVLIEDGTLTITSGDHGLDVNGSVTVTGGTVNVTAGDDGFNVRDAITISGGAVTIDAEDIGLDCSDSGVTITGGTLDITTRDYDGIEADGDVLVSGGAVSIDAGDWGVFSYGDSVTISGGSVEIAAKEDGIWTEGIVTISGGLITVQAEEAAIHGRSGVSISDGNLTASSRKGSTINGDYGSVTISGGNLDLSAGTGMVVFGGEGITVEGDAALPEGVTIQEDEFGEFHISVSEGNTLSILTPFTAELKEGSIQFTKKLWGLKVLFASYDIDGRMTDVQVVEVSGDTTVPVPAMEGEVTAFFLSSRSLPVHTSLPID